MILKTPDEISPYGLIQERLRKNPWQMLVATILLNQTHIRQVTPVFDEFVRRWPNPTIFMLVAKHDQIVELIKPCGFQNRRAATLMKMTHAFDTGFENVANLPGVGKYSADSYNIFVGGYLVLDVQDNELKRYVEWALGRDDDRAVRGGLQESEGSPSTACLIST